MWILALRLAFLVFCGLGFIRFFALTHRSRDIFESAEAAGRKDFWAVAIRARQQFASVVVAYLQVTSDDG